MTLTPRHRQTLAMFEEFGWHEASVDQAMTLPVGSWAQRQTGKKGLTSGDLSVYDSKHHEMLTLFAIRVGVTASRIRGLSAVERADILADVVMSRGAEFAQEFVDFACRRTMRRLDDDLSRYGATAVLLVTRGDVPLPKSEDYFNDWTLIVSRVIFHNNKELPGERYFPSEELLFASMKEHIQQAVPSGIKISGPFREIIDQAYAMEIISRTEAIELGLIGINSAKKFSYRQDWVDFLVRTCGITPKEIIANYDAIKRAATIDRKRVLEDLVAPIIPLIDDESVLDILPPALNGSSLDAAKLLFQTLVQRDAPNPEVLSGLAPLIYDYAGRKNCKAARPAANVIKKWKVPQPEHKVETKDIGDLWQPAPQLWALPRFSLGKLSLENLETQLQKNATREKEFHDLEEEQLIALLVKVAHSKTKGAQRVAKTAPEAMWDSMLHQWSENEFIPWSAPLYDDDLFIQRRNAVLANLGQIPCLLSEPSYLDFTITMNNFVSRLKKYAANNAAVLQPDLLIALFRLDLKGNIAAAVSQVKELNIDIVGVGYTQLDATVGEVLEAFVADPLVDPGLQECFSQGRTGAISIWEPLPVKLPASLTQVSGLVPQQLKLMPCIQLFPHFGDSIARRMAWNNDKPDPDLAAYVSLLINRAKPLSPAMASNLLAAVRPTSLNATAEMKKNVHLAWSRGLLRLGVANINDLDWRSDIIGIRLFMETTRELAEEGLLSIIWDMWVQFLQYSVDSTRLLGGTNIIAANLVDFAKYIPEKEAVKAVPAVRALATRRGQSEAIYAARKTLEILPKVKVTKKPKKNRLDDAAFAQLWPENAGNKPAQEDHTTIECQWSDTTIERPNLDVYLKLPSWSGVLISPTINVDEGACYGILRIKDFDNQDSDFYARVYWDGRQLIGEPAPDPRKTNQSVNISPLPLKDLSTSLVAVAIGSAATKSRPQEKRAVLTTLVKSEQIGVESVKIAMQKLLLSPDFSPARAAYTMEHDPTQLPYLWPILTEGITFAAQQSPYPRWVSKLLTITFHCRQEIVKALELKRMSHSEWDGVASLAAIKKYDIAVAKAQEVAQALGL